MRLLQYTDDQRIRVGRADDNGSVTPLAGVDSVYQLARKAIAAGKSLEQIVARESHESPVMYAELLGAGRLLLGTHAPFKYPHVALLRVESTGATGDARDALLGQNALRLFRA